jgi:hypothetical protein
VSGRGAPCSESLLLMCAFHGKADDAEEDVAVSAISDGAEPALPLFTLTREINSADAF